MRLKGHARLILKDAKTGREVFREEHDNAITPSLEKIFGGDICGCLNYNQLMPVLQKLLGGVCIFNGTVDDTKVFLPRASDATLTAHAGQTGYDDPSDDRKRGTPGTSYTIPNGYRFAWSWANTQGNGNITDICLTHCDVGDYWNEDTPNTMSDDFCPVADVSNGVITPEDFGWEFQGILFPRMLEGEKIPIGFIDDMDHVVSVEGRENNIRVHISKFTGTGAWIWNSLGELYDDTYFDFTAEPWQQGTFSNYGIGMFYVALDSAHKKLYAIACGQTNPSDIYLPYSKVLKINVLDLTNGTKTTSTVDMATTINSFSGYHRTDGSAMPGDAQFFGTGVNEERDFKQLQIVDGSIFIPIYWVGGGLQGTTDCSIRVDLSDPSDQEIVQGFNKDNFSGNYGTDTVQINLGNGRIMNTHSMAWADSNGDYKGQAIDVNRDLFMSDTNTVREYACAQLSDSPVQYFTYCAKNASGVRGCILNKLYQATVFHIENGPLTKTASVTMTLEYDITQEEES